MNCAKYYLATAVLILLPWSASAEPMAFELSGNGGNCNGCEWIAAQGEITADTPQRFQEYVDESGGVFHVTFHSPGGNLIAGIRLGRMIRELGATTSIGRTIPMDAPNDVWETTEPGECSSACFFAWMGGVDRYVSSDDRLGVHQFSWRDVELEDSQVAQAISGLQLLHTLDMGISARALVPLSLTSPDEIYWFNGEELREFGLTTDLEHTGEWTISPVGDGDFIALETTHRLSRNNYIDIGLFCTSQGKWLAAFSRVQTHS